MKERTEIIIGGILYLIWAIVGAWTIYDEILHPYIPEHVFILVLGVMPFVAPVIIFIGLLLDKQLNKKEPKPL